MANIHKRRSESEDSLLNYFINPFFVRSKSLPKKCASMTDETPEMTEETEINISPFLFAMMVPANKSEMEDHANAGN